MFAQEGKGAFAVDRVWAVEVFDFGFVLEALQGVVTIGFSVFVGDPFVGGDAVVVAAFDHEGARANEPAHFGVVEGVAEVEFEHFVFAGEEVAVSVSGGGVFPDPFVEVC